MPSQKMRDIVVSRVVGVQLLAGKFEACTLGFACQISHLASILGQVLRLPGSYRDED